MRDKCARAAFADPLASDDATSSRSGDDGPDGAVCRCAPRARAMRGVLERAAILDTLAPDVATTRSGDSVGDSAVQGARVADKWLIDGFEGKTDKKMKKKRKRWAPRLLLRHRSCESKK